MGQATWGLKKQTKLPEPRYQVRAESPREGGGRIRDGCRHLLLGRWCGLWSAVLHRRGR